MATTALKTTTAEWRDYLALCKPNVVALIVFTAVVGMLLASPGMVPLDVFVFGTLGIGLASASAAAINHVVDGIDNETISNSWFEGNIQQSHGPGTRGLGGIAGCRRDVS